MKLLSFEKILFRNYMSLILITALLISIFSGYKNIQYNVNNQKQNMYESLVQAQININNHAQMIEDYLTLTHSNTIIQTKIKELKTIPTLTTLTEINDTLFSIDLFKKNIDSMQIFAYDYTDFLPTFSTNNQYSNALFSTKKIENESWFQETLKLNGHTYWFIDNNTFKQPTLCASRILFDCSAPNKILGIVKANITIQKLINHLGSISFGKKGYSMIQANNQLLHPDMKFPEFLHNQIINNKDSLEKSHILLELPLYIPNFSIVGIISKSQLYKNTLQNLNFIMIVLVLSILLAIILSSKNSKKISSPLNHLCENITEMKIVDNKESHNCIEINQLYSTYNSMLKKNESLMKLREETVMKLKQAEMAALQSQMNPHFIYNTLESVNSLIAINDNEHASLMITGLSNFLRSSLNNGNNLISLEKEIEQVTSYFQIMKLRYCSKIELILDLPDPIPDYYIIKLILQPLVENSIVHGFKDLDATGKITIKISETDDELILSVADNGWGSDIEMLNYIVKQRTLYKEDNINFYCIQNIYQRLQNRYGDKSSFIYEENEYGGVTAKIIILKEVL